MMKKIMILSSAFFFIFTAYTNIIFDEWKTYTSDEFSIGYPENYFLDTGYSYDRLDDGRKIKGISFMVSPSLTEADNLVDAYISVEWLPDAGNCGAKDFFSHSESDSIVNENGVIFSTAYYSEGAAGSLYEEYVYSRSSGKYCYGIRLHIHSASIENYIPGTVKEYDRQELENIYRKMRESFKTVMH